MITALSRASQAFGKVPAPILALAAGVLTAVAHPPFGFLPGLLGYGLLMRLGDEAVTLKGAFWRGWLCGLGYFAVGCWWVAEAFLVDAETFGWMAPFAVTILAGGLALFWGLALLLYRWLAMRGIGRVLMFAAILSAAEWLRGHVLTGFPWNLPGETWQAGGAVSQFAAVVGAYGLTFITIVVAAAPALLWRAPARRPAIAATAFAAGMLAIIAGWGAVALSTGKTPSRTVLVRAVQPDIPQAAKYDQASYDSIVAKYLALTAQPSALGAPALVVWPEGAIPAAADSYLAPGNPTRAAITAALKPGQILLVGAYRFDSPGVDAKVYNTLVALRRDAADVSVIGVYDKHRLVPFGEYMPLESLLTPLGVKKLVPLDSFSSGPPPAPVRLGPVTIQPLICYESLYPGFTREGAKQSGIHADIIVNISNDAWFGATSGPLQHLNLASYRAIEEGLPMVRATPTGISAIIDSKGRVQQRLGLGAQGVVDHFVALGTPPSLYARLGDAPFFAMLLLGCLVYLQEMRVRRKTA